MWFNQEAKEAAQFYTSIPPYSKNYQYHNTS
nr:VOC family protein [Halobacillus aidingensis]